MEESWGHNPHLATFVGPSLSVAEEPPGHCTNSLNGKAYPLIEEEKHGTYIYPNYFFPIMSAILNSAILFFLCYIDFQ